MWLSFLGFVVCLSLGVAQTQWTVATLSVPRDFLGATSVGTKAFFAGGSNYTTDSTTFFNVVDIFDSSTNTWSTATLSVARNQLSATSVGTKTILLQIMLSPRLPRGCLGHTA